MPPKVSIIIACYDDPNVKRAIGFAAKQEFHEKEVIVVDDGSGSEVKEVIHQSRHLIDILIEQHNQGQSIARNNAIHNARGEYILNWDSDDYFESTFCAKAVAVMEKDEDIKIVTCAARRFNEKTEVDIFTPRGGNFENFLFSNSALGSSMFRKKDWKRINGYDEILPILGFEDWEFYLNILKEGGRAHVIQEVLFNYMIREGSTTHRIRTERKEKFKHIILKHAKVYSDFFPELIEELFRHLKMEEREKNRIKESQDYRLGKVLLRPLRWMVKIIRL